MRRRHPIPVIWLMTDERMGKALWPALRRLPRGAGVVFRHYATPLAERRALFKRVRRIALARRLVLLRAGANPLGYGDQGTHGRRDPRGGLSTWPVHDRREALAARRGGADALFVSPVRASRSHPAGVALGPRRACGITRGLRLPIIALGGMDACAFRRMRLSGFHGWAAIDAWLNGSVD